ncbi:MAG TPA: hypothetical protein VGY55_14855 [Pirellulales bacterium]|jgi:hypothetical protein|nr:hypothetical protein [Pirellulales bacterium]
MANIAINHVPGPKLDLSVAGFKVVNSHLQSIKLPTADIDNAETGGVDRKAFFNAQALNPEKPEPP